MRLPDPMAPFFAPNNSERKPLFDDQEYRPQQESFARGVLNAISDETIFVCEAGTGTGKTLAYLLPLVHHALESGTRVLISTETRSLQKQILASELPAVSKYLGKHISAELCFGGANYLCPRRLKEVVEEGRLDESMAENLTDFLEWADETDSGLFTDYKGIQTAGFRFKTCRDPDDCGISRCSHYEECHYFIARDKWKLASVLIVNHSLLSAHFVLDRKLLPEFSVCTIDEAHAFPSIFASSCTDRISFQEFSSLIRKLPEKTADLGVIWGQFQSEVINKYPLFSGRTHRLREGLDVESSYQLQQEVDRTLEMLGETMSEYKERQEEDEEESDEMKRLGQRILVLERINKTLGLMFRGPEDSRIHWIEETGNEDRVNYTLHSAPVDTGSVIRDRVLSWVPSFVFTSATLGTGGKDSFQYFLGRSGIAYGAGDTEFSYDTLMLDSPFDYKSKALLFIPPKMPDPVNDEDRFHHAVARGVRFLHGVTKGGTFVLFTSIRSLQAVHKELEELDSDLADEVILQTDHGPQKSLEIFREREDSVLFGLSTFWQGIDITGDSLRSVIIVRIPFKVPDDPIVQGLSEYEEKNGRSPFFTVQLPVAIISIKQGFGRLIRTTKDRGIVSILDPRIRTRGYGKRILESLPHAQRVDRTEHVTPQWTRLFPDG